MGRTEWDKSLIDLFNPSATYFHCEEALRDSFIISEKRWKYSDEKKIIKRMIEDSFKTIKQEKMKGKTLKQRIATCNYSFFKILSSIEYILRKGI